MPAGRRIARRSRSGATVRLAALVQRDPVRGPLGGSGSRPEPEVASSVTTVTVADRRLRRPGLSARPRQWENLKLDEVVMMALEEPDDRRKCAHGRRVSYRLVMHEHNGVAQPDALVLGQPDDAVDPAGSARSVVPSSPRCRPTTATPSSGAPAPGEAWSCYRRRTAAGTAQGLVPVMCCCSALISSISRACLDAGQIDQVIVVPGVVAEHESARQLAT